MIHQPIHTLADAYRRGDLTPTAVAEAYLARIDALDRRVAGEGLRHGLSVAALARHAQRQRA